MRYGRRQQFAKPYGEGCPSICTEDRCRSGMQGWGGNGIEVDLHALMVVSEVSWRWHRGLSCADLCCMTGAMLNNLLSAVPELRAFANLRLEIPFNLDSARVGPTEWVKLAKLLHRSRDDYDAFLIVHGEAMSSKASALNAHSAYMCASSVQVLCLTRSSSGMCSCVLDFVGTDTMAYTASALSLLLAGFKKPIVMTGMQNAFHHCCYSQ